MSFFCTLPSNSSKAIFPNNLMSDYTTILLDPFKFNGQWEVALASFTYRQNIEIIVGSVQIFVSTKSTQKSDNIDLTFENDTLGTIFKFNTKVEEI